jgi:hypothetical protein
MATIRQRRPDERNLTVPEVVRPWRTPADRFHSSTAPNGPPAAMKLLSLILAALVLSSPTGQHTLRFSPADGAELTRTTSWKLVSRTDSTSTTLDGEVTSEVPSVSYTATRQVELGVTDTLEQLGDGRPQRFVRRYSDLLVEFGADLTLAVMGQEAELALAGDGTSALEGLAVRFEWSDEDEDWRAKWADDAKTGPDALLKGLRADMDLLALLPGRAVDIGDTWTVELAKLVDVLFPGGDVGLVLETDLDRLEGALDPADLPTVDELLSKGKLEGEAKCKLVALEGEVAKVELELEVRARAELVDELDDVASKAAPEGVEVEVTGAVFELVLSGNGQLSFGLTTGHVSSFTFDGTTKEESLIEATVLTEGETLEFAQQHARSGTLEVRITIE